MARDDTVLKPHEGQNPSSDVRHLEEMSEVRIDSAQRFVESSQMGRAIGEIQLQTRSARSNDCSENF
jgi:hypothetical protein